jgi:hypothetical protein
MQLRRFIPLLLLAALPSQALPAEPYPYAGVFSVLEAEAEKHYDMTKFTCLASLSVQRADGGYTAYHVNMAALGKDGVARFHPYEMGVCEFTPGKNTEHCKVTKSNWGKYEYYIDHRGEIDGAHVQAVVSMKNPTAVTISNMRKCPFSEERIEPHLSDQWLNYSDDDINWVLFRYLPFNPDLAAKAAKDLGIGAP